MIEAKLKHLEFIQGVIQRLSNNSFFLKGWAVTLTAAVFALAAKESNANFALLALIPNIMFWSVDAFFLSLERQFIGLYVNVSTRSAANIDFSMDATPYRVGRNRLWFCLWSATILPFHGVLFITTLVVTFALRA